MQTTDVAQSTSQRQESAISRAGLNAANFFLAEAVGVVLPVLNGFLRASGWRYDSIGIATAVAGLGTFLFQTPAGLLTDRINSRRALFGATSLLVGVCFVCLPLAAHSFSAILGMLFTAGAAQSFFAPVLAALAWSLVGYARINKTMGDNQDWNHEKSCSFSRDGTSHGLKQSSLTRCRLSGEGRKGKNSCLIFDRNM